MHAGTYVKLNGHGVPMLSCTALAHGHGGSCHRGRREKCQSCIHDRSNSCHGEMCL